LAIALWLAIVADKTPNDQVDILKISNSVAQKTPESAAISSSRIIKSDSTALDTLIDRVTLMGENESQSPKWRNLFASSTWTPSLPSLPVAKQATPVIVPMPTAPVFPYLYIGKKLENNVWEVYLSRGDQSFLAREGVILEGNYRVDTITPQRLTVTYLPLGQSQSLSIEETQF
jgi:hypothetical protein